jgi:hypothetical protein
MFYYLLAELTNKNSYVKIMLEQKDFSFCPEIRTKIGLQKIKIKEVSIKYRGRKDGKKLD